MDLNKYPNLQILDKHGETIQKIMWYLAAEGLVLADADLLIESGLNVPTPNSMEQSLLRAVGIDPVHLENERQELLAAELSKLNGE